MEQQKSDKEIFLDQWFNACAGHIEIRILPEKVRQFFPTNAFQKIDSFLSQYPKSDIFVCVCTRNGSEGAIESIPGLWINLSFEIIPQEKATKLLKTYPLPPTFVIRTGAGLEVYWRFIDPIKDIELLEQIDTQLKDYFELNDAFDISEALRLPGTANWEYNPPRGVELLTWPEEDENVVYEPDAFLRIGADTNSSDEGFPREEQQKPEKVTPKDNPEIVTNQGFEEDGNLESNQQSTIQIEGDMILDEGWVPLFRKVLDSQVFQSEGLLKVWIWCLLKVTYKERWVPITTGRGTAQVHLLPGQFIFGRRSAAKELKMKPSTVWKRTKHLLSMGNLNIKSNRHYSVATLTNWEFYRELQKKGTAKGTTKEPPSNTNKKDKKYLYSSFPLFEQFYKAYPKKQNKDKALKAWQKLNPDKELLEAILKALEVQKKTKQWQDPQFIPLPASWLNAKRWQDEIDPGEIQPEQEQDVWSHIPNR